MTVAAHADGTSLHEPARSTLIGARGDAVVAPGALDFVVPAALEAGEPPEARGLERDEVRLLVTRGRRGEAVHARFRHLADHLEPGDVVVVNASATMPAAVDAEHTGASGARALIAVHFSSPLPRDAAGQRARWAVELRRLDAAGTKPLLDACAGDRIPAAGGARITLIEPWAPPTARGTRLWVADVSGVRDVNAWLASHGRPIRYGYVRRLWPLAYYQTMFAAEWGSAEMPSAGRAFTPRVVDALDRRGVRTAPIVLHTGVASLESDEPPYPERYRVPAATAAAVNDARARGGRVVAIGTTVVRALETVARPDGSVRGGAGWTDLAITPEHGLRAVDAMLTGFHEPRASHLAMLAALAGRTHLANAYDAALRHGYLWHEFGDLHLILPD